MSFLLEFKQNFDIGLSHFDIGLPPPATDQVLGSCDQKVKVVNNFDFLNKVYKQSCKKLMLGTSDA